MKNRAILFLFSILFGITQSLFARGADIAFQGLLNIGGAPANGSYDLTFQLFDAATNGNAVGAPLTNSAALVSNGLFTVMLDFGDGVFAGSNYWVQIGARTNGGESFTNLSPLLPISPTPYAITAGTASNALVASALSGTVSNANLSGSYTSAVIFSNAANHFIGNGAGLTSLPISGSAVTTNSNPYGLVINLTTGAGNPSGGSSVLTNSTNTWTGTNLFTNTVIATNGQAANQFAGTFTGNGAGLSNVVAVALSGNYTNFTTNALNLTNAANLFAGTFAGNGAGLTNLPVATNVPTFTAGSGIIISTNAGSPTNYAISTTGGVQTNSTNVWTGTNTFSSAIIATNSPAANQFAGTFIGNGAGLTNVTAAAFSGTVSNGSIGGLYSNAVTLNNTNNVFAGDGSGLVNLPNPTNVPTFTAGAGILIATNAGSPTNYAISATGGVQTNDNNIWTGTNTFSNAVIATNGQASNQFAGTFIGNGAGLTNVTAVALSGTYTNFTTNALTITNPANVFAGNGSGLTNITAAVFSGTLSNASLSGLYTNALTFSNSSNVFIGNGTGLTNVTAAFFSGTLSNANFGGLYSNAVTFSNANNVFAGDGSGLTNLPMPTNAPTFTAGSGIVIVTNAGSPTNYAISSTSGVQTNYTNVWTGTNTFTNAVVATNNQFANRFAGTFTGNGVGLTNISASVIKGALPSGNITGVYTNAVTFIYTGDVFGGTFAGNGAGVTNLPITGSAVTTNASPYGLVISSVSGVQPNFTNTWTGTNLFTNTVIATNGQPANKFAGTFIGNGAGLTNVTAAIFTGTVSNASIGGVYTNAVTFSNSGNVFTGNGAGLTGVVAASVSSNFNFSTPNAVMLTNSGNTFAGNGAGLSNLDASQLTGGPWTNATMAGITNFGAYFASNPVTAASFLVTTNGHVITVDEHGDMNKTGTNGLFGSFMANGNFAYASNGNFQVSGNSTVGANFFVSNNASVGGNLAVNGLIYGSGAGLTNIAGTTPRQTISGTNAAALPNESYFLTNEGQSLVTLPTTANVGDVVTVTGVGTNGWEVASGAGQNIAGYFQTVGANWVPQNSGIQSWLCVASSADGSKLVAAGSFTSIYTSTNSGTNWTAQNSSNLYWLSVASSVDGTRLVAAPNYDQNFDAVPLYTSSDSGMTWTAQTNAPDAYWESVASSADGTKLVAVENFDQDYNPGLIYTSTNSGTNWTAQNSGTLNWSSVASSADGSKLAATAFYDQNGNFPAIYTSSDSGVTWTAQTNAPDAYWQGIASSADGSKLVAVATYDPGYNPTPIYTSTNSGTNWTAQNSGNQYWYSVASSSDGTMLAAAFQGGPIYGSSDSGVTWTAQNSGSRTWYEVASSADGTKLAAVVNNGAIYTSDQIYFPFVGAAGTTAEFQYSGDGVWQALSTPASQINGTIALANLPGAVVTNGASGIDVSGMFSGDGSGLTNLNPNVALLSANQAFTGSNAFNQSVVIANGGSLQLIGNGGGGATAKVDLSTYNTGTNPPTTRIQATDDGNAGNSFDIYTKADGNQANGLVSRLHVSPNGNVGIGTTSPGTALAVNGNVSASNFSGTFTGNLTGNLTGNATTATTATTAATAAVASNVVFGINITNAVITGSSFSGNGAGLTNVTTSWQTVPGIEATAAANEAYLLTNNAENMLTLPATTNVGAIVTVSGVGSNGWQVLPNAGQTIAGYGAIVPAGTTWTDQVTSPIYWNHVASSSDGTKLVVVGDSGIYTSVNSGTNWTFQTNTSPACGYIASSADGTKLVAAAYGDGQYEGSQIYTSTNSGTNWTAQNGAPITNWTSLASSADGTKLVALDFITEGDGGGVYTSIDSGMTWTAQTNAPSLYFGIVASSSDGTKLVEGGYDTPVYISTDSGTNWTEPSNSPVAIWESFASSADGTALVGGDYYGDIYTSKDSGVTWTMQSVSSVQFDSIASSSDGSRLVAVGYGYNGSYYGRIYTSINSGTNWTEQLNGSQSWTGAASSADGTKLVAVAYGGIYTSDQTGIPFGGSAGTTAQFQYVGNGVWQPLSAPASQIAGVLSPAQLPAGVLTNTQGGVTLSGTFGGNGGGLTNLNASQLSSGTISLALLPPQVVTNTETNVTLSGTFIGNLAGNATIASNVVSGISITNAFLTNAVITNSTFAGNAFGLTNLNASNFASGTVPLALLPPQVVTNTETNVSLSGTFFGNLAGNATTASNVVSGISITNAFITNAVITNSTFAGNAFGLTNINASNFASGTVPLARLPSQVVTNTETNVTLSGTFIGNLTGTAVSATTSATASNIVSGISITNPFLTNAVITNSTFGGVFIGSLKGPATTASNIVSGASITNVVITSSTFAGNGSGLTNLSASQLVAGSIADSVLPANVVTINGSPYSTNVYSSAGTNNVVVPAGVTQVIAKLWGAGGGGGSTSPGGGGAFVQKTFTVVPGQTLTVVVGQRGDIAAADLGGVNSSNAQGGSPGYLGDYNERGQGGQASSVFMITNANYVMEAVAGAGGGGGLYLFTAPGGAGGNPGASGTSFVDAVGGVGGYNGNGGAGGGTGSPGSSYAASAITTGIASLSLANGDGGNATNWSGGGGGGYGGGGGGGSGTGGNGAGGGGGGSYGDIVIAGTNSLPGNNSDPNYVASNGTGGTAANGSAGSDGLVVLVFETPVSSIPAAVVANSFSGPLTGNATTASTASNVVSGSIITNVTITNSTFAGNGTNLTNLNAANLTSGTVPIAALAALPAGTNNIWTGTNTFTNGLYASNAVTGGPGANSTMTLNGKTYEGYLGIGNHFWTGLTNGVAWFETSNHYLWQTNFTTSAAGANIVYSNSFFSGNSGTVRLDFNATAGCPTNGSATVSLSRNYQYVYYGASGATPTEANTTTLSLPAGTTLATAQAVGAGYFYLTCSGVAITNVDWEVEIEIRQKH